MTSKVSGWRWRCAPVDPDGKFMAKLVRRRQCMQSAKGILCQDQSLNSHLYMKTQHLALAAFTAISLQPLVRLVTFFPFWRGAFPSFGVFIFYSLAVLIISSLVVLLLGIPCFDSLNATGRLNLLSLSCCGIILGMLPYLLLGYPRHIDTFTAIVQWHGFPLKLYENGNPATAAWLDYAETAFGFGVHGFIGSLVFYFFWCRYRTTPS